MPKLLSHGGWCPCHRRAEDGVIPAEFSMTETPSEEYEQRTEWNVRDSDATVIFTMRKSKSNNERKIALNDRRVPLQGGTLLTKQLATNRKNHALAFLNKILIIEASMGTLSFLNFGIFSSSRKYES
mmetsp:Transcript_22027/g.44844  ORF Transcript_22027/g.44844 Transcript_22027/m.44844 type:complete len:127 (+) Transcript_22027:2-382(+)